MPAPDYPDNKGQFLFMINAFYNRRSGLTSDCGPYGEGEEVRQNDEGQLGTESK